MTARTIAWHQQGRVNQLEHLKKRRELAERELRDIQFQEKRVAFLGFQIKEALKQKKEKFDEQLFMKKLKPEWGMD